MTRLLRNFAVAAVLMAGFGAPALAQPPHAGFYQTRHEHDARQAGWRQERQHEWRHEGHHSWNHDQDETWRN